MQSLLSVTFVLLALPFLTSCSPSSQLEELPSNDYAPDLVIYSGITMVRPLKQIAERFEAEKNVHILIEQGASSYLYETISSQQTGDIYFPGSSYFRVKHKDDNILLEHKLVGYNRLAIVATLSNPKNISLELKSLLNPEYSVVLPAPDSGSVGKATEKLLDSQNLKKLAYRNTAFFTTDSHRINQAIIDGRGDIALNWYATTRWEEAQNKLETKIIDDSLSPKRNLELNLLKFSKNPTLAKEFINYATTPESLESFYEFGFLTDHEFLELKRFYLNNGAAR